MIMFDRFIDEHMGAMLSDLDALMRIPSVSIASEGKYPYGKAVDDALQCAADIAARLGFEARNLKYLTEISFGSGPAKIYIACHADVVACAEGWTHEPYAATVENGRVYGRGAIDDKGPLIAVLYALASLKASGFVPGATIKMLVGGAEETGMDDLPRYVAEHGYPDFALTPDSLFPVVNTEAGMFSAKMKFDTHALAHRGPLELYSLRGGSASNCVPDRAFASVYVPQDLREQAADVLQQREYAPGDEIVYVPSEFGFDFTARGISAHASEARKGRNAVTELAHFLCKLFERFESGNALLLMLDRAFTSDFDGGKLGIACTGDVLPHSSLNVGICDTFSGFLTIDMRIPRAGMLRGVESRFEALASEYGMRLEVEKRQEYTHVPPDSEYMRRLGSAFETACGRKMQFLASSGLTYSKVLGGRCVAYGPVFEEDSDEGGNMHSSDEYISVEALRSLAIIYAQTLRALCGGH